MAYDRDEIIRHLVDYYSFCQRVFWETELEYPPPGGWPTINHDTMANLHLNDKALDLIRHLLYPKMEPGGLYYTPIVMPETEVADYRSQEVQEVLRQRSSRADGLWLVTYDGTPPQCVGIAMCSNRYGYWVIVDTDSGYIYWGNPDGAIDEPQPPFSQEMQQVLGVDGRGRAAWASSFNVYEPADFFEAVKQNFREMLWVPEAQNCISVLSRLMWDGVDMDPDRDEDPKDNYSHNTMAIWMVRSGWPGDGEGRGWDKEKYKRLMWTCGEGEEEEEAERLARRLSQSRL